MGGQYGVENIIKAVEFGFGVGDAIKKALADDGKIKGFEYFQIATSLWPGVGVIRNLEAIKQEFLEMDEDDKQEVIDHFAEDFDIPNDAVEAKIEKGFAMAIAIVDYVLDDFVFPEDEIPEG